MEKKTFTMISQGELEELIKKEIMGIRYDIVAMEEWDRSSFHIVKVKKLDTMLTFNAGTINDIMNALCFRDFIEPGAYMVGVY